MVWGGAEIRRPCIATPVVALLVAIASETRHEEARIERIITDQQLVEVWTGGSHGIPQSQSASSLSIIGWHFYWKVWLSLEINFVSTLMINKHDFCKLIGKYEDLISLLYSLPRRHLFGLVDQFCQLAFCSYAFFYLFIYLCSFYRLTFFMVRQVCLSSNVYAGSYSS